MKTFSALLALCAGNSPVTGEFPSLRPVTRIFDVFFDLRLNKRLSKQSWGWWFQTPSCSSLRHCNVKAETKCPPFSKRYFKLIFLNENVRLSIKISLKFVPRGPINNISALVQIVAWRRPGDKPLYEPVGDSLLTHICFTRSQSVKRLVVSWCTGHNMPQAIDV